MNKIEIEDIKTLLPHRLPFLLVDRVSDYKDREWIEGYKNLSCNEPIFAGHFPEKGIYPGVLMTESLAQISGILLYRSEGIEHPGLADYFYYAGMDNVRFKRMVIPGDRLDLRVDVIKARSRLWKFKGVASVDGHVACEAEFMIMKDK
jgi:3-hydroxyacyl-[acyl-carrier-protein] dehydratase